MLSPDLKNALPTTDELPSSDDTPVDNEDQNFLPNILLFLLNSIWANRIDWYFGVDMGVYHTTGLNSRVPVVPDAFLSVGVERKKGGKSRKSYAVWEENEIVPIFTLEMVSHTPGGEYDEKLDIYRKLRVLYYVIYEKSEGLKPRPLWAKQSLYPKVGRNPTPCGWLDSIANCVRGACRRLYCELRIGFITLSFGDATNINPLKYIN